MIREPGAFLRAYDLLLGAGWDPEREGAVYGRELAREMKKAVGETPDRHASRTASPVAARSFLAAEPLIANLLVVGFNAAHWPLWDLLKAVVFSAEQAVVALSDPRVFAEEIDQLWISSWEEVTQTEAFSPDQVPSPQKKPPHLSPVWSPLTRKARRRATQTLPT